MKFTKNTHFWIAKKVMRTVHTKQEPLDYKKWIEFIDSNPDFIWYEHTESGKETLLNISEVPEDFRTRVLDGLNKVRCYKEEDRKRGGYNINCTFHAVNQWISIGFDRTPKMEDLRIFVEMAKYLDALLLKDGKTIIDEKVLSESI